MSGLNNIKVKNATKPGKYRDGRGLFLLVKKSGARSWVLRMQYQKRQQDFGLGSEAYISLSEAREKALETRKRVMAGQNPIQDKIDAREALASALTFEEAARKAHVFYTANLKNEKSKAQWINTLETYAFPTIGSKPIEEISRADLVSVVEPIWHSKAETASRIIGRLCKVTLWASGKGLRETGIATSDVSAVLGSQNKVVKHHAAMDFVAVPAFVARLASKEFMGRLALRFLIMTAARSGEVRGAVWSEIDLDNGLWTIPGERMKAGREHIVPLTETAIAILRDASRIGEYDTEGLIFPNTKGKALTDTALSNILDKMKIKSATVHGFRSSFADWAAEETEHAEEVREASLAHVETDKVKAAYTRTKFFEKRKILMQDWAAFLEGETA